MNRHGNRGRRFKQMGLTTIGQWPPAAVSHGIVQRRFFATAVPVVCPKCGNRCLVAGRASEVDQTEGRRLACPLCAWEAFYTAPVPVIASTPGGSPHAR